MTTFAPTLAMMLLTITTTLVACELNKVSSRSHIVMSSRTGIRVLRGQKRKEKEEAKVKQPTAVKKARAINKGGNKNGDGTRQSANKNEGGNRQFENYNYFLEACQEELLADLINGNLIKHSQYVDFIYGYCHQSDFQGDNCNKDNQDKGFTGLTNDIKLLYIKGFCPQDVDGQVSCLHGMNERGRQYDLNDQLDNLCIELELLLLKNNFLIDDKGKNVPSAIDGTAAGGDPIGSRPPDHQNVYQSVGAYQTNTTASTSNPMPLQLEPPTQRPTENPTPRPTISSTQVQSKTQLPPWEQSTTTVVGTGILQEDTDAHIITGQNTFPQTTSPPTDKHTDLAILDTKGNLLGGSDVSQDNSMPAGTIVAIILIVLLGITIAHTAVLLLRKKRHPMDSQNSNYVLNRGIFYMKRKVKPSDGETETHDKTYEEEQNDSIGSEEIDFHGPLFESWPAVSSHKDDDDVLIDTRSPRIMHRTKHNTFHDVEDTTAKECDVDQFQAAQKDESDTDEGPSTFTSSLLSSFFSRARGGGPVEESPKNAIAEIKRAINEAQWQEVYYLASKMAAEGNIDSDENLQSALVRNIEAPNRDHLNPEDALWADQLDVSLVAGDWITLAARAAVFAALDSANNPVPVAISFEKGQISNVDRCLARAKVARQVACSNSLVGSGERVLFSTADDATTSEEFDYPKEDYSDFSRSSEVCSTSSSNSSSRVVDHPTWPHRKLDVRKDAVASIEDVDSSEDDSQSSATRTNLPGPPSIAMSNQSTIPTQPSAKPAPIPFATFDDACRGPFRRDFENGIGHPLEQDDETEQTPNISV